MTVEPSAVRFAFGTSVRTWPEEKPSGTIIAPIFRDIGQPNTGLSPAVVKLTRDLMIRKAREEGHAPGLFKAKGGQHIGKKAEYAALRKSRLDAIMRRLTQGPARRADLLAILSINDGAHFTEILRGMTEAGLVVMTKPPPKTTFTITDAGRAYVAAQVAA